MTPPHEINLSRIEQGCNDDRIDDVLVIWFAAHPVDKGQVVVGWCNNTTVFKSYQAPKSLPQRDNYNYYMQARAEDCAMLPVSKRKFAVGHNNKGTKEGNPGTANVFYVFDNQGRAKNLTKPNNKWILELIKYIESYDGPKIAF